MDRTRRADALPWSRIVACVLLLLLAPSCATSQDMEIRPAPIPESGPILSEDALTRGAAAERVPTPPGKSSRPAAITNFAECVQAGYRVLKTYPGRCIVPGGGTFVDDRAAICKNLCGDGECQEMVCMGAGCPCAETSASCPKDCH